MPRFRLLLGGGAAVLALMAAWPGIAHRAAVDAAGREARARTTTPLVASWLSQPDDPSSTCEVGDADPAIDPEELTAIDLINDLRRAAGAPPVSVSLSLTRAAAWKARAIANGAPFDHLDPFRSVEQRLIDCGSSAGLVSEDLSGGADSATATVDLWFSDPPHRDIMRDPSSQSIGIARATSAQGDVFWCVVFSPDEP